MRQNRTTTPNNYTKFSKFSIVITTQILVRIDYTYIPPSVCFSESEAHVILESDSPFLYKVEGLRSNLSDMNMTGLIEVPEGETQGLVRLPRRWSIECSEA